MSLGDVEARRFPKGVYVVTSCAGDRRAGMTAAWVARVSGTPAMMAVALHPGSATGDAIRESGWFVIHALPESGVELARSFGRGSSRRRDKFAGRAWTESANGQPILTDAIAYAECRVVQRHGTGDHELVIGEVTDEAELHDGEPLRYREVLFGP